MGALFFGENDGHSLEVVDDLPISASDVRNLQLRLRPGERWDPKYRPLVEGLAYMAAQADFNGTREYFDREMNKLLAKQYKPLCSVNVIPKVKLTELEVSTAGYYDRLNSDMLSGLIRDIVNEITATVTLGGAVVDPLLFQLVLGLPVRVVPKNQCCQPLTAVPARPHKKKRIRKKWLKKYGWKIIYGPEKAWILKDAVRGDMLCVGPDTYKELKETGVDVKDVAADD